MGFFDDLTKKASETYKNTAEKTNKLTREMKLKSLMNDDKAKINSIYCEIGKKVYEKHIREENIDIKSELAEECSKIDAYSKEIEDMRIELLQLKDLRMCKVCAAEIPLNAKFCPKCGSMQEEDNTAEQETAKQNVVEQPTITENVEQNIEENNVIEQPIEIASEEQVAEQQITEGSNSNQSNIEG